MTYKVGDIFNSLKKLNGDELEEVMNLFPFEYLISLTTIAMQVLHEKYINEDKKND